MSEMKSAAKKKLFYPIDEVCARTGLTPLDIAVLACARRIQICASVSSLLVEDGHYEIAYDDSLMPVPMDRRIIYGLVDLRPDDAWHVLRAGSQTIRELAAEEGCFRRLVSEGEDEASYSVIREEVGVRHEELARFAAVEASLDDIETGSRSHGSNRESPSGKELSLLNPM